MTMQTERAMSKAFWSKYRIKSKPSSKIKMSPEKAEKILRDGSVHGHPLTKKQKGLFGSIAGRKKK
jgi:hypothetical protein